MNIAIAMLAGALGAWLIQDGEAPPLPVTEEERVVIWRGGKGNESKVSNVPADGFADVIDKVLRSTVIVYPSGSDAMLIGHGSGVIVSGEGYILTNSHVVTALGTDIASMIVVELYDGSQHDAEVIGNDAKTDLAVLKIEAEGIEALKFGDSDHSRVGDLVFAVGNNFGVGQSVTMGIVSAKNRRSVSSAMNPNGYRDYLQTDAAVNVGNSGGPLVDGKGDVIGINTAIYTPTGFNYGISFAIPSNMAGHIMSDLIELGYVRRGMLGVQLRSLGPNVPDKGALILRAPVHLAAYVAGVRDGDIVTAIDGIPVEDAADLRLRVSMCRPGVTLKVTVDRNGTEHEFSITLMELSESSFQR